MTTTALAKSKQMDFNNLALMCQDVVATGSIFVGGNALSATELGFVDGVTAGTATASKALVLDSSKGISTITSATITTLTSTTLAGTPNFTGATTFASTVGITGALTTTGGVVVPAGTGLSLAKIGMHTGGVTVTQTTDGNDTTPATTETFIAPVFVPYNVTLTGVAIFNGSATGSGNVFVGLADSTGAPISAAVSASTAISGTDAFQLVPFAVAYAAKGPAVYYVMTQYNNVASRFNTHILGAFGTLKQTGQTFSTLTSFTPPLTFTANVGPIATLY